MRPALPITLIATTLLATGSMARDRLWPSRAIYPPAGDAIRFSHQDHQQAECVSCHAGVVRSVAPGDRNLPREAVCRPCHEQATRESDAVKTGPASRCRICHTGYDGSGVPERLSYPPANVRFSHRLHHDKGVGCVSCHQLVKQDAGRPLPRMGTCRQCHERRGASNRCVVCHLSNKDGRVVTRYPTGLLLPSGSIKGDAHTPEFYRSHRVLARQERRYCESCHQPRQCLRCHAGTLRPMSIHGGDYVTRHANDARRQRTRCRSCHRDQSFCLGCHQRSGVGMETPDSGGFRPSTGARYHPPGFVGIQRGPRHHSYAARRNISTCVSCHRESTCVRCHGTRRIRRGGFSPHPPGFGASLKCRALSARNQRVCLKCHHPGDRRIECR